MIKLVVATRNRGKIQEIQASLADPIYSITCSADYPGFPETIEDEATFQENALKKAREAMKFTGLPALADDSGLVVDALDGRPGVLSARFAGVHADDDSNNQRLLLEMQNLPDNMRRGAFVCVMAYVSPGGTEKFFSGRVEGSILKELRGKGGFGYDPLFLVDSFDRTMAELDLTEKNTISHRGQALHQFLQFMKQVNK